MRDFPRQYERSGTAQLLIGGSLRLMLFVFVLVGMAFYGMPLTAMLVTAFLLGGFFLISSYRQYRGRHDDYFTWSAIVSIAAGILCFIGREIR